MKNIPIVSTFFSSSKVTNLVTLKSTFFFSLKVTNLVTQKSTFFFSSKEVHFYNSSSQYLFSLVPRSGQHQIWVRHDRQSRHGKRGIANSVGALPWCTVSPLLHFNDKKLIVYYQPQVDLLSLFSLCKRQYL